MDHIRNHLRSGSIRFDRLRLLTDEPRPTYLFDVPGGTALDAWAWLGQAADDNAVSPIILGDADDMAHLEDAAERNRQINPDDVIDASLKVDAVAWLRKRSDEQNRTLPVHPGEWPDDVDGPDSITSTADLVTGIPFPKVAMALVPTPASWEAPAYLRFGGWNQCPEPAEHIAVWRRWNKINGAEIVCITADVIEANVSRPPADKAAALALAREQYAYCEDIVTQGVGSVEALAAALLNAPTWFFWWD